MSNVKEQAGPSIEERLAAAESRVAELEALVRAIVDERHRCFIPTNITKAPGLLNWDDRARAALAGGGR